MAGFLFQNISAHQWGKNKAVASLSPSARPFLISHVIPASWLTKFKQMSVSPQQKSNQNGGKPTSNPAITQFHSPGGRFYSADGDDAFWRLSFGDECEAAEDYISDHDEASFPPPSSCCCTRSNRVGAKTSFILPLEIGNFPVVERDKVVEVTNPRIRSEKKKKVKRSNQRVFELGSELSNSIPQMELEDTKMVEGMRKSLYIRTEQLQRKQRKSHHHSPRTPETCKIRAIEDMRRSSSKTTKRKANKPEKTGFDGLKMKSFAVVKSSYDPENDFKESMVEMIQEMRIRKTEELEELLACYLMLNCEEYHELIINVFRQVWFDLNHHAGLSWS